MKEKEYKLMNENCKIKVYSDIIACRIRPEKCPKLECKGIFNPDCLVAIGGGTEQ